MNCLTIVEAGDSICGITIKGVDMSAWYYSVGGVMIGPYDEQDLIILISLGSVSADTLVARGRSDDMRPVRDVPEFAQHIPGAMRSQERPLPSALPKPVKAPAILSRVKSDSEQTERRVMPLELKEKLASVPSSKTASVSEDENAPNIEVAQVFKRESTPKHVCPWERVVKTRPKEHVDVDKKHVIEPLNESSNVCEEITLPESKAFPVLIKPASKAPEEPPWEKAFKQVVPNQSSNEKESSLLPKVSPAVESKVLIHPLPEQPKPAEQTVELIPPKVAEDRRGQRSLMTASKLDMKTSEVDVPLATDERERVGQKHADDRVKNAEVKLATVEASVSSGRKDSKRPVATKQKTTAKPTSAFSRPDLHGGDPAFFYISIKRFVFLSIFSCGAYEVYWLYMNWKYLRDRDKLDVVPPIRALFGVFFCHSLFDRIYDDFELSRLVKPGFYPSLLATAWILLVVISFLMVDIQGNVAEVASYLVPRFLCFIPLQRYVNRANMEDRPDATYAKWSYGEFVSIAVGLVVWIDIFSSLFK